YSSKLKNENEIIALKKLNLSRVQKDLENTIWLNREKVSLCKFLNNAIKSGLKNTIIVKLILKRLFKK
ncbi:MAG: hypothetical protein MUE72_09520, partial [Chitinophagaceae bacterium]|nr:hypothetical protein [Chitinophagaceae bacterium]